jgi:hypothetical protein
VASPSPPRHDVLEVIRSAGLQHLGAIVIESNFMHNHDIELTDAHGADSLTPDE